MDNIFKQIDGVDDNTRQHANELYAEDGWAIMRQLKHKWFAAGANDARLGIAPVQLLNDRYMAGYHTEMAVKAALVEVAQ